MLCRTRKPNRWSLISLAVLVILGVLSAPVPQALADSSNGIVRNDYFVNHKSIEPLYEQYNLHPNVLIHVREVVLSGRERTAPKDGKVLLLLHGYPTPGYIAFDLDHENCSMMRYLALHGWDTFALDYEGYGLSTRPPSMDVPSTFPESKAPIHSDVAINDVERVVDFIMNLRGVEKVHLLGWSLGASRTAPIYTIRHQDRVAKLVLFAPGYESLGLAEQYRGYEGYMNITVKVMTIHPSLGDWYQLGTKDELLIPGVFEVVRDALLDSDPKSDELGGSFLVPLGRLVDMLRANPQFDASKITIPTLVIRGEYDKVATREDNKLLVEELASDVKKYVEIPNASHIISYEKANIQFFKAVKDFLEAKAD